MRSLKALLENPVVYGLWQRPFAGAKLAPIERHGDIAGARRVLDIGCGPGTNARRFASAEYVGLDINPAYIEFARTRYAGRFEVADVRSAEVPRGEGFDFVLVNSLLHHLETDDVRRILARVSKLLTDDGRVHVLDLVLPSRPTIARLLARWDRGAYARPLDSWRALFSEALEIEVCEPYSLPSVGPTLWNMVYLRGRSRP
jgi:SAM-dependent methyltransferase